MKNRLIIAVLTILSLVAVSCKDDRSEILKVYNWSCYIDESLIGEFEDWYEEQTGESIKVIYQTFDVNETMLSKIEKGHEDYDVVCPSDYIIERMLNNGMLTPLDFASLPDEINYIENNKSPFMCDIFRRINPSFDANDYSVPYMWGTTGILYNTKYVTDNEASTWDVIRNPKFANKIFVKDACRDVFGPILMFLRQEELKSGAITMDGLMRDASDAAISDVESYMEQVRPLIAGWEADFGKEQMTQEKGWVNMTWSGDAVWAMIEAEEVGVNLKYVVPESGSNIWFDGWVIPKYAVNVKAATYFIDFMCRPDVAIRNMEETGYVSANGDMSVLESQVDESFDSIDVSYFFGEDASSIRVNPVLYPDKATIERCCIMHDWGNDTDKLVSMWSRVKGENANLTTVIVILVAFAALAALGIVKKTKKNSRRRRRHRRRY